MVTTRRAASMLLSALIRAVVYSLEKCGILNIHKGAEAYTSRKSSFLHCKYTCVVVRLLWPNKHL